MMPKNRQAVFLDRATFDQNDLDFTALENCFDQLQSFDLTPPEQCHERLTGKAIVITNKVQLRAEHFAQHPELKLVLLAATGTNNIDLEAARAYGVTVCNCRAYGSASVAQHTLQLLLALNTHFLDYQRAIAQGEWSQAKQFCLMHFPIRELAGQTLGILGYGELGQAVAQLAEAFGMRILLGA